MLLISQKVTLGSIEQLSKTIKICKPLSLKKYKHLPSCISNPLLSIQISGRKENRSLFYERSFQLCEEINQLSFLKDIHPSNSSPQSFSFHRC